MSSKHELPKDNRFPILCSDGTVLWSVEDARKKAVDYPESFSSDELTDAPAEDTTTP